MNEKLHFEKNATDDKIWPKNSQKHHINWTKHFKIFLEHELRCLLFFCCLIGFCLSLISSLFFFFFLQFIGNLELTPKGLFMLPWWAYPMSIFSYANAKKFSIAAELAEPPVNSELSNNSNKCKKHIFIGKDCFQAPLWVLMSRTLLWCYISLPHPLALMMMTFNLSMWIKRKE